MRCADPLEFRRDAGNTKTKASENCWRNGWKTTGLGSLQIRRDEGRLAAVLARPTRFSWMRFVAGVASSSSLSRPSVACLFWQARRDRVLALETFVIIEGHAPGSRPSLSSPTWLPRAGCFGFVPVLALMTEIFPVHNRNRSVAGVQHWTLFGGLAPAKIHRRVAGDGETPRRPAYYNRLCRLRRADRACGLRVEVRPDAELLQASLAKPGAGETMAQTTLSGAGRRQ